MLLSPWVTINTIIYFDHVFSPTPPRSSLPPNFMFSLSLHKKNGKKIKQKDSKTKNMPKWEFIFCLPITSGHGTYPEVRLVHPMTPL